MRDAPLWAYIRKSLNVETDTKAFPDGKRASPCIFAVFPHAAMPLTAILTMQSQGGVCPRPIQSGTRCLFAATRNLFVVPFLCDLFKWGGMISADRQVIEAAIDGGRDVVLCPGGVQEMMLCDGHSDAIYTKHTGFLALAVERGVSVCPVFLTEEGRLFHVFLGRYKTVRRLQSLSVRLLGYPFPFFVLPNWSALRARKVVVFGPLLAPALDEAVPAFAKRFFSALKHLRAQQSTEKEEKGA